MRPKRAEIDAIRSGESKILKPGERISGATFAKGYGRPR